MKKIIIAEKPSLAMVIKNAIPETFTKQDGYYESEQYIVTFVFGHLFELYSIEDYLNKEDKKWCLEDLPYIPDEFKFKLKDDPGIKKQFKIIKELTNRKDVSSIVNCGDADREGELLVNIVINETKTNKPIYRLWLPEQTPETIRKELKNLQLDSNFKNLNDEGMLRLITDNLLGIQYTRYLSILTKRKLPVGRVLIPIVKKIYDRDLEIKTFKPQDYFVLKGINEELSLSFNVLKSDKNLPIDTQKEEMNNFSKTLNKQAEVVKIEEKDITKRPSRLFSLDKLQNKMANTCKMSPADTLKTIQKLYEKGYVTYPRTNTEFLSNQEADRIEKIINLLKNDYEVEMKNSKTIFDDSKIESHSAITITTKFPDLNELNQSEQLVYNTIKNRFISNFLSTPTIITEKVIVLALNEEIEVELKGKSIKSKGYLEYENDMKDVLLPDLKLHQMIDIDYSLEKTTTKAKNHINSEELMNFLKNPFKSEFATVEEEYKDILSGIEIGTVATRAGIIENAIQYGYIENHKNSYQITTLGEKLIEILDKLNINLYKEKTVELSKMLKKVYNNQATIEDGINVVKKLLQQDLKKQVEVENLSEKPEKEIIGKCPRCGKNVYEGLKSFYCEGFKDDPKCDFSLFKDDRFFKDKGKKITKTMAKAFLSGKSVKVKGLKKKDGSGTYDANIDMIEKEYKGKKYINFNMNFN